MNRIEANIVDIHSREIFQGSIEIKDGIITNINRHHTDQTRYIIPGFIDAHVHIESSMLTPENFGKLVVPTGTVAVVTDPHEIANVLGINGIEFMLENSINSPIKTYFTIPSCVPATSFDVSGAIISSKELEILASSGRFVALSEMMNVPGVLSKDPEVMKKLSISKKYNLQIDGHAPLLRGTALYQYSKEDIKTDHECSSMEEAEEKICNGMKIMIREGSAAMNYEALKSLIKIHPEDIMFCTDDLHPDDIISNGHINKLVRRAISDGFDLFDVLRIASSNSINHYKLDVGQLRKGDKADFIIVDNLKDFNIEKVYIDGENKILPKNIGINTYRSKSDLDNTDYINNFNHDKIEVSALKKVVKTPIKTIKLIENEIITQIGHYTPASTGKEIVENLQSDIEQDLVKIVYINRYHNSEPQIAFCQGFNMKKGAFASSISHDSHNIIAVGCSDEELADAINAVIEEKGALAVCVEGKCDVLPLPLGGIISLCSGEEVAAKYSELCHLSQQCGCNINSPFMTLSFLSLVVIPEIRIGEKGLFNYSEFKWI